MSALHNAFLALAVVCGAACLVGFVGFGVTVIRDDFNDWWMRPAMGGMIFGVICIVGALATEAPSPLSRGIVATKRERSYMLMVMVGKVMIPQYHHVWELVSPEGATCSVGSDSYAQYQTGDAIVCAWKS